MDLTVKRLIDIVGSFLILLLLGPLMVLIAIGILATMGRPVLFRQRRPGLGGETFTVIKFRTMRVTEDPAHEGQLLIDRQRLTPLGRILRRNSLDELPQLFNVLLGTMSLVGPRPLLPRYLPYHTERERQRHAVKPGITGWAQINGRNAISWNQRLAFDVWYVEHQSLLLDLRILSLTCLRVLQRRAIDQTRADYVPLEEERRHSPTPLL
jgi:lipopolysaccharide/colanic/teichoic acid biosynthesis glycosyltransferase